MVSGRMTLLIAVLICQCSFAAVTCEFGLLRLEGVMLLTGLDDGDLAKYKSWEVL